MLITLTISVLYQFGAVFIVCEIGEQLKNIFVQIDELFEQLKWYLFPIDVQQVLPLIIANTLQEAIVECFGSFSCARETFKKVRGKNSILSKFS